MEEPDNRNIYDLSDFVLKDAQDYKLRIDKCREKRFELKNKITNEDLSAQIRREKLKLNRIKREFYRYIDAYLRELELYGIDYEQYIPENDRFKFQYVYRIAYGVLNDI